MCLKTGRGPCCRFARSSTTKVLRADALPVCCRCLTQFGVSVAGNSSKLANAKIRSPRDAEMAQRGYLRKHVALYER